MTFKTFSENYLFSKPVPLAVTTRYSEEHEPVCVILIWEPSNQKWYQPKPMWGREEVGYLDTVTIDGVTHKIIDIREV